MAPQLIMYFRRSYSLLQFGIKLQASTVEVYNKVVSYRISSHIIKQWGIFVPKNITGRLAHVCPYQLCSVASSQYRNAFRSVVQSTTSFVRDHFHFLFSQQHLGWPGPRKLFLNMVGLIWNLKKYLKAFVMTT